MEDNSEVMNLPNAFHVAGGCEKQPQSYMSRSATQDDENRGGDLHKRNFQGRSLDSAALARDDKFLGEWSPTPSPLK